MRKIAVFLLGFFFLSTAAWAQDYDSHDSMLNKFEMNFSAEQWVTTKSALVTVNINASVNGGGLDKVQAEVINKLNTMSAGDWHIMSFNRTQDQSGLENVTISAQARLLSSNISNLRDQAKSISKAGETFTVDNIAFTPSETETRDAMAALRSTIYTQTKDEIDRLNKMYPDQKFYVHSVEFRNSIDMRPPPMAMPMMGFGARNMAVPAQQAMPTSSLAVGDKLVLSAVVVLASLPADRTLLKSIT